MLDRQGQNRPLRPYAPTCAESQTAEPRKSIQEDPGEIVFQTMNTTFPVRPTRPPRSAKSICILAPHHQHLGQEPVSTCPLPDPPKGNIPAGNAQYPNSELDQPQTFTPTLPTWSSRPGTSEQYAHRIVVC